MEITDDMYQYFLANEYPKSKSKGISPGRALKTYLKENLENLLTDKLFEIRNNGSNTSNIKISKVKIADIVFAFNNAELIKLLKKRGRHIMFQQYDQMREVEREITKLKDE